MGVARLRQHVEDAKGVEGQKCRTSFVVTPVMIRGWGKDPGGQERCVGPQGLWVRPWYGGLLLLLLTLLPCKPQASPARCPPPLPALLRLNGHPYLEKQQKGLMVKKEVGEVVAGVQLLLSPFLSSLKCELVKDPENRYSFFGVREVFSATTLSQGEECQVYYARTGLPTSTVNLTLLVGATLTGDLPPSCTTQTQAHVVLQVQFCSRRDYDICGLDEPSEEPRASNTGAGEFDEFPVGPPAVLGPEFPILEPEIQTEVMPKVPTERPDLFTYQPDDIGSDEEWEGEFQPVLVPELDSEWDEDEGRGFRTEEPKLETEQGVVAIPVTGEEEEGMENGQTGDALIDKIRVALFSTDTAPITIAVLSFLLASSLVGLACLYCKGRHRSPSTSSSSTASTISSSTNMTNDNSKPPTKASEVSSPKKAGGKGAEISRHNLPKITLPLSRQPRLFDENMVMYFQEVEPLGEKSSGVVKHPKTLVTRRSWTAAQED